MSVHTVFWLSIALAIVGGFGFAGYNVLPKNHYARFTNSLIGWTCTPAALGFNWYAVQEFIIGTSHYHMTIADQNLWQGISVFVATTIAGGLAYLTYLQSCRAFAWALAKH